jgi:molybdopterin-guanine dinucleotide biosynthesis protein MobB
MPIPTITFIGKSGAGKTTLLEKLIPALKARGYHVAAIKHHSHVGFEIDVPGKDSWRLAQAGSEQVIIAAPDKIAAYRSLERELELEEILPMVSGADIILAEGYRRAHLPTIEVVRTACTDELYSDPALLVAIVSDRRFDMDVPQLGLEDVAGLTDLIVQKFL